MILELYMKNCALVEELRLTIDENLNILTGETGSGKSIIIDALGLCLGEKYDRYDTAVFWDSIQVSVCEHSLR